MTTMSNEILYVQYRKHNIKVAAKTRRGGKDLLIFLHGIGCSKESFNDAFFAEALKDYSICSFDFPGYGESSRLPNTLYSLQSYADITELIISQLTHDRIYVVGHSMGGAVGIIAARGRNDIECFVNADGNLVAEDCGLVSRKIASQSSAGFIRTGYDQFVATLKNSSRSDFGAWAQWCENADPDALHQTAESLVEWSDSGKLLEFFNALRRTAYLYGIQDDKKYLLHQIAKAKISAVPDSGHFMMVDNPDRFYQLVAQALAPVAEVLIRA